MDTPITRAEHEEFRRTVNEKFDALNERLHGVEELSRSITEINVTLQKQSGNIEALSKNIADICSIQKQEGERLKELESADGKKYQKLMGYIASAVVSGIIGFLLAYLGLG